MDLLSELEAWVRAYCAISVDSIAELAPSVKLDLLEFQEKFDERARLQAQMRANVEELHRSGARLIANANREYAQEADLD